MNAENFLHFLRDETQRRDAYKLLSSYYYRPTADKLETLGALETTLKNICPEAVEFVMTMRTETDITQLEVDYAKLFMGPYKLLAPPYGSVYLEGKREVMGHSTIDALNHYQAAGLAISGRIKEAPDHIAIELEFLYYLIFKELEAIETGTLDKAKDYLERQKLFLERHLGAWVTEFSQNVETNALTDFYRNLAKATRIFVERDCLYTAEMQLPQLESDLIDGPYQ